MSRMNAAEISESAASDARRITVIIKNVFVTPIIALRDSDKRITTMIVTIVFAPIKLRFTSIFVGFACAQAKRAITLRYASSSTAFAVPTVPWAQNEDSYAHFYDDYST